MPKNSKEIQQDRDFVDHITRNITAWHSMFSDNNERYQNSINFAYGQQWTDQDRAVQHDLKKPTITVNKIYSFYRYIAGEFRSFRPDYKLRDVRLAGKPLTQDKLDFLTDLMRQIHHESNVQKIYQEMFRNAVLGGYGVFAIYADDDRLNPFLKTVRYMSLPDSRAAFFDPAAKKATKTDGQFAGVCSWMNKAMFKSKFGYEPAQDLFIPMNCFNGDAFDDNVLILDYYERSEKQVKYLLLSNNMVVKESEWKDFKQIIDNQMKEQGDMAGFVTVIDEKVKRDDVITHYKIAGSRILDQEIWNSPRLPIVFCDGDSRYDDGKQITTSAVEFAKDPQRYLNYLKSEMAHTISTLRREIIVGTPDNILGREDTVKNISQIQGFMAFNPDMQTGMMPQRWAMPEIPQSFLQQYESTLQDIKEAFGMFEANRGEIGNEVSGVAIERKISQGDLSNSILFDNALDAIREGAQIVFDVIPYIYNTERKLRIRNKDGSSDIQEFNPNENEVLLRFASLQVEVSSGANFRTQRTNELNQLNSMVMASGNAAQLFSLIADQYPRFLDSSIRDVLQQRLGMLSQSSLIALQASLSGQGQQQMQQQQQQQMMVQQKKLDLEQQRVFADLKKADADMLRAETDARDTDNKHNAELIKAEAEIRKALLDYQRSVIKTV